MYNFGPSYRTTAAQRAARLDPRGRADVGVGGGSLMPQPASPPRHVPTGHFDQQRSSGNHVPALRVGDEAAGIAHSTHQSLQPNLSDIVPHDQLMDLDNSLLESMVEDNGVGVDLYQRPRQCRFNVDCSSGTQYRTVDEYRHDRTINLMSNLLQPNDRLGATSGSPTMHAVIGSSNNPNNLLPMQSFPNQMVDRRQNFNSNQNAFSNFAQYREEAPRQDFQNQIFSRPCQELGKTDRIVVMELIKNVVPTNGGNEFELLQFLKDLRPIFEVCPNNSGEIVKLLMPKVSGQLFKLWVQAVSGAADWESLHVAILECFIPPLRRREVEAIELERPQRPGEDFSDYVENVISTAFALRTRLAEADIIESILNKCSPDTKRHFTFGIAPKNLSELRSLATRVTSSVNAEFRYFGGQNSLGQSFPSFQRQNQNQNFQGSRTFTNTRQEVNRLERRPVNCFKCGRVGHLQKNCRQSLN